MSSSKLQPAIRIQGSAPSIWVEFGNLIAEYQPIALSRGCPDFLPPSSLLKSLENAAQSENVLLNQYTRSYGHLRLVNILSKLYGKMTGRDIDAKNDILVTIGAYEALYCSIMGNVNQGDEVIIIEPYYDCYVPMVKMAGGIPVFIPLLPKTKSNEDVTSADWILDFDSLSKMFNSKTKAIILNTPHNPTGKVFSKEELNRLAELVEKWDVLVICDEVYEWLVYDGKPFTRFCTLPGMWNRTISIGSAGKMFSATGWKIGWAYGCKNLISNLQAIHQNSIYTCPTLIQESIAEALEEEFQVLGTNDSYSKKLCASLELKRNMMVEFCKKVGLKPVITAGSYFMIVDYTDFMKNIDFDDGSSATNDYKVSRWLIKEKKIAMLPITCFYSEEHKHLGENYVRIAFVKTDEVLEAAKKVILNVQK